MGEGWLSSGRIEVLSDSVDETVSFKDEHDINAVTGLLKLYFRELRNPLMTHEYYEYFIDAASKI